MFAISYLKRCMLIAAAVLLWLSQCARTESPSLAELLAAEPTRDGLTLTVPTGGCTKKSDFELISSPINRGGAVVEVRRPVPDFCKGNFPDGIKLAFSWAELKLPVHTKISVKNPVLAAGPSLQREARPVKSHKPPRRCAVFDRRSHLCTSRHRAKVANHYARHRIHQHGSSKATAHHTKRHVRRHHRW
jgi:hypothetical protein